jgi:hypothetical protein
MVLTVPDIGIVVRIVFASVVVLSRLPYRVRLRDEPQ